MHYLNKLKVHELLNMYACGCYDENHNEWAYVYVENGAIKFSYFI